MIKEMLIAGAGGFAGTCGRYLVNRLCAAAIPGVFPSGTLAVNLIGCFAAGLLFGLAEKSEAMSAATAALLVTGFCGGFTTFSTFANDMWKLSDKGDWMTLALYLAASVAGGFMLVCAGRAIIR
ncbi:MAG: fluoride efflux transporter CrcB [[Clostridium] fimetarium]|nr:fluoride efflux transporter CrcB [Alistipes timonensis]MCM1406055.1 fluoride efflux transporter CrcB [[Clostridium] fimetarium]